MKDHLEEVDKSADEMFEQLNLQMKAQEGITEELKDRNQLEWVQRRNSIHNHAAEIVYKEWIYICNSPNVS